MTDPELSHVLSEKGIAVSWKYDFTALKKRGELCSPEFEFPKNRWELSLNYFSFQKTNVYVVKLWAREIEEATNFHHEICILDEEKKVLQRVHNAFIFTDDTHSSLQFRGSESELRRCKFVQCRIFFPKEPSDDESDEGVCEDFQGVGKCALTVTKDLKTALETGKHSDVVLKLGEATFPAHKMILSCRCKVFGAMFDSDTKENTENVVDLVDMDAAVAKMMLQYMYTGKTEGLSADNMVGLYTVADRYSLLDLLKQCRQFILRHIEVENVSEVAIVADLHSDDALMKAVQKFFCENLKSVFQSETLVREKMFEKDFPLFFKLIKEALKEKV